MTESRSLTLTGMASPAHVASAPLNKVERGHQLYREGRYSEALLFYTEALSMAKAKPQKIALHSNRAACFLKLHDFEKAAEECTSVLELDHDHTGALMLRAQTLVTLKEYHSALFDVNRLIELNPSSEVYQNLQARLKTQLSLAPIPESEAELEEEEEIHEVELEQEHEISEGDPFTVAEEEEKYNEKDNAAVSLVVKGLKGEQEFVIPRRSPGIKESSEVKRDQKAEPEKANDLQNKGKESSTQDSKGWQTIPKPKGHSTLDYARWDRVEDDSSEEDDDDDDDDDDEDCQYRFRVRTVGVRQVK